MIHYEAFYLLPVTTHFMGTDLVLKIIDKQIGKIKTSQI